MTDLCHRARLGMGYGSWSCRFGRDPSQPDRDAIDDRFRCPRSLNVRDGLKYAALASKTHRGAAL